MTPPPADLDLKWSHDGLRVAVKPWAPGLERPDAVRNVAVGALGIFVVLVSLNAPVTMTLLSIVAAQVALFASLVIGQLERRKEQRRRHTRLCLHLHRDALRVQWLVDGLPSREERIHLSAVAHIAVRGQRVPAPELYVYSDDPGRPDLVIPLQTCSLQEVGWIAEALRERVAAARERDGAREAEIPSDLQAIRRAGVTSTP